MDTKRYLRWAALDTKRYLRQVALVTLSENNESYLHREKFYAIFQFPNTFRKLGSFKTPNFNHVKVATEPTPCCHGSARL